MKKILVLAAMAFAAMTATAGDLSANVKYDYDRTEHTSPWLSGHREVTGVKYNIGSVFGTVDAGVAVADVNAGLIRANGIGYDVGYSNGVKVGSIGLTGRVGYSHYNFLSVASHSVEAGLFSYGGEATFPLCSAVTGFAGIEHIRAKEDLSGTGIHTTAAANRLTAGVDFAVTKNVSARVGYAHLSVAGDSTFANGVTTAVSYKF